ncbi:MAG: rRNA pseudouridine synthase [Bacteroidetes bacterium]|nr:rRNA pseudouridine synthase [Bacteroidota bacterium]
MAREGRTSGKTSFGKRTQAEKNFRDRKKGKSSGASGSGDEPRERSFSGRNQSGKTFGRKSGTSFRKRDEGGAGERSFSKPAFRKTDSRFSKFKKDDSTKRSRFEGESRERRSGSSFRKTGEGSGEKRFSKPGFRKGDSDRFSKFKREGSERPTGGRFNRDENKSGERSFSKPGFRKDDSDRFSKFKREGSERPTGGRFNRDENKSGERSFSKAGFRKGSDSNRFSKFKQDEPREKSEFSKEKAERPFGDKKERTSFRKREDSSSEKRFSSSDFKKTGDRFSKLERGERSKDFGKPFKSRERKKSFGGPKQEHQRKNIDSGLKPESDLIRLNKFMANSGVGSRREADELIKMGLVTVNGETITEMGHKVKLTDDIRYEGRKLKAEPLVYVLLNKPKGFITTTDDPEERNTVMDLVANACKERIYPVGRLDRNTTGLLLLTNDGDLADKLTHPSYNAKKIYKVELDRPLTKNDSQKIIDGVYFEEGRAQVDDLAIVSDDGKEVGIELHIGWNRIVRRIFEALGYQVERLDRVAYAGLDKKDLGRGQWRFLKPEEVVRLKHFGNQ